MSGDSVSIRCKCGEVLSVDRSAAGGVVACPSCAQGLRIPAAPAADGDAPGIDMGTHSPQPSPKAANPYAAPATISDAAGGSMATADEDIRHYHLSHEASLQSIGILYFIGALILIPLGFISLLGAFASDLAAAERGVLSVIGLVYSCLGILQAFAGYGIRKLRNWARLTIGVLAIPGLLGVPVGTLISGYIMYLCFSQKGVTICTPEYHEVIKNTPHIKYKTSIVVKIFLVLLLIIFAVGMAGLFLGG